MIFFPRAAWSDEPHPKPRPGIDGSRVLRGNALERYPKLVRLFDDVRRIPAIMDGIRCHCGCPDGLEYYSLLSCFEAKGMARECSTCRDQAALVVKLRKQGKSLAQIRAAIDAEFE